MQKQTPQLRIVRPPEAGLTPERAGRFVTVADKKALFKSLVVHSLDAGFLRYSRRQELLRVAEQLGFDEFEACLLIAEAQFHSDSIHPAEAGNLEGYDVAPIARKLTVSTWVVSALVLATLLDVVLIIWLM